MQISFFQGFILRFSKYSVLNDRRIVIDDIKQTDNVSYKVGSAAQLYYMYIHIVADEATISGYSVYVCFVA